MTNTIKLQKKPPIRKKTTCSWCGRPSLRQAFCKECHAAYQRAWRKNHPKTEEQKLKAKIRRAVGRRIQKGLMERLPCEVCGDPKSEAHHPDYANRFDVQFLCKKHHWEMHNQIGFQKISMSSFPRQTNTKHKLERAA